MPTISASQIIADAGSKDAVIFDYDSTLARIPIDWPAARKQFREHMGELAATYGLEQIDRVDEMEYAILSKSPELANRVFEFRRRLEHACAGAHQTIPGACELVRQLASTTGATLHIISNNLHETVIAGLSQLKLEANFTCIIGVDDAGLPKPHPGAMAILQQSQPLEPTRCLFIGDNNRTDGQFCKNLGIPFVHLDDILFD